MPTLNILPPKAIWLYQLLPDTNQFNTAITLAWLDVEQAEGRPIFHLDLSAIPTRYATLRATLELDSTSITLVLRTRRLPPRHAHHLVRTQATWNSYITGFLWTDVGGAYAAATARPSPTLTGIRTSGSGSSRSAPAAPSCRRSAASNSST